MIAVGLFNAPMRKSALTRSNHKDTLVSEKTQLDFLVERLQVTDVCMRSGVQKHLHFVFQLQT
jgi:hypothetical protein